MPDFDSSGSSSPVSGRSLASSSFEEFSSIKGIPIPARRHSHTAESPPREISIGASRLSASLRNGTDFDFDSDSDDQFLPGAGFNFSKMSGPSLAKNISPETANASANAMDSKDYWLSRMETRPKFVQSTASMMALQRSNSVTTDPPAHHEYSRSGCVIVDDFSELSTLTHSDSFSERSFPLSYDSVSYGSE